MPLLRFLKHLLMFIGIILPLTVIGWIILYPVLLVLPKSSTALPRALVWFDNVDGDGLIGDLSNQQRNADKGIDPEGAYAKYKWIAFRNPIQGFKYLVLGAPANEINLVTSVSRSYIVGQPVGDYTSGGTLFAYSDNRQYYEYYYIIPYKVLTLNLCVRIRFGWKLIGIADKPREYISWTFALSPWHTYRGIYGNS